MALYLIGSGHMQTTAAFATLATGATIKTLLQVVPGATVSASVVEWGVSFDGSAAATPGKVELIETDVGATITQTVTADITKFGPDALGQGDPVTALFDCSSTTKTGFNASAEGSITTVRNLAGPQLIAPTNQFVQQFPLGREPIIQLAKFGRIRVTFGAGVNAYAYMIVTF
jgi:hypothetical protein